MYKIAIVDDQRLFLEGFSKLLETVPDFFVLGTYNSAANVLERCDFETVDAILMDICMEGRNSGIEATKVIKEQYPKVKIIIMTGFAELSLIQRAKEVGADSFMYKEVTSEEFVDCTRRTIEGEHIFPEISSTITFGNNNVTMVPKELEVLKYVCQGKTYQEIADSIGISINTVKYHLKRMLAKTGHKSIVGLAVEAANKGLAESNLK